ncbi:hypothetical protein ACIBHX_34540 [Nonomuraea sp. NPDC050536]|uniref:hypothetical protein n=1 Tax=Nonomuraea sp. NPDC050536 TaxID=3364366 RepID=UPI0037C8D029
MIEIDTFLKVPGGGFVQAEACRIPPSDLDYIEGAIRISIDGLEIIGLEEWDYVDQLWCYIAEMITRVRSTGYVETYFPDQPIKLSFRTAGSRIVIFATIGEEVRKSSASAADLLNSLKEAGLRFFDKMSLLAPEKSYSEARRELLA